MAFRYCGTQHRHIRLPWIILILRVLSSSADHATEQLQLRKHINLRQTNNVIASAVGNDLTSRHCAVRCSNNKTCDAYNCGMTSDGEWICEEIKNDENSPGTSQNEVGWSYYEGYTSYMYQYFS